MVGNITALGYGLITLAILIGVGSVVLYQFGGSVGCNTVYNYWNATTNLCQNTTRSGLNTTIGFDVINPSGNSYTNINYLNTQLGSGGLSGWVPAIIAVTVGLLFLGAFFVSKGPKGNY